MNLIVETERLIQREILQTDAEGTFKLDNNPKVMQYLGGKITTHISVIHSNIEKIRNQYIQNNIGRFAVILKETNQFIGWSGLKFIAEPEKNFANFYDIGNRFQEEFWGKGYAYESALPWIDYAFKTMKIDKLNADAHINNIGSNKILQKLGMQFLDQYEYEGYPFNWYELENPNK